MTEQSSRTTLSKRNILYCLLSSGGVWLIAQGLQLLHADLNLTDITILFLLLVIVLAVYFGSGVALLTSVTSVLAIDYFFCPPFHSLEVTDPAQVLTLSIFLLTAAIISQLTAGLRGRMQDAQRHELQLTALSQASWIVAAEPNLLRSMQSVVSKLKEALNLGAVAVIGKNEQSETLILALAGMSEKEVESIHELKNQEALRFVFERALPIGDYAADFPNARSAPEAYKDAVRLADSRVTLLPAVIDHKVVCVLYIRNDTAMKSRSDEQLLAAFLNHLTLAWQRDQFVKAEAIARALAEADRLKTALLSMVSHDFRTPLTSIKTNIGTLRNANMGLSHQLSSDLLSAMDEELDRLNRMVGNILDLSRLEAGAWQPKYEPIPLTELIGSVLGTFNVAQDQRIEIVNKSGSDLVWLDAVQIQQVLRNLLENALKYSGNDTKVEFNIVLVGEILQFEILDRGIGLNPGEEILIFEPFYRGKNSDENALPGAGMGLAICRGLVEAHGGLIVAEARAGSGSCFRVTLPYQKRVQKVESGKT
jgi:two-component system, OmpR family, sensor histidine kinase KdpD